jgi:peptide-methionine (R)-S-oxide reductase
MRTAVHADDGRAIVRVHNRETDERAIQALPDTVTPRPPNMSSFDLTPPSDAQRSAITASLSDEERHVLLAHGTEAPFCGVFLDNKREGVYVCRFCGLPLFRSSAKFDSGTGWPSFFEPYAPEHIRYVRDDSYGMVRVEEVCARCGSHLGHVFPDGPPPTGQRHCLNSVSMGFVAEGDALPDPLQRDEAETGSTD